MSGPIAARLRRQMELNHRNGHTIEYTLLVPIEVHLGQHHAPHLIDNPHQVTSSPIEAALLRQDGKLIPMCLHMTEQLCFHIPTQALADQTDGYQFTIATRRLWPRSSQMLFQTWHMSSTNTYTHRQKSSRCAIIRLVLLVIRFGWSRTPKLSHQGTFFNR